MSTDASVKESSTPVRPLRELLSHRPYWVWTLITQLVNAPALMAAIAFAGLAAVGTGEAKDGGFMVASLILADVASSGIIGKLADRTSGRVVPVVSAVLAAAGLASVVVAALADASLVALCALCVVAGLGLGGLTGLTRTLLNSVVPERLLERALAVNATAMEALVVLAPLIAGGAIVVFGWTGGVATMAVGAGLLALLLAFARGAARPAPAAHVADAEHPDSTRKRREPLWNLGFIAWLMVGIAFSHDPGGHRDRGAAVGPEAGIRCAGRRLDHRGARGQRHYGRSGLRRVRRPAPRRSFAAGRPAAHGGGGRGGGGGAGGDVDGTDRDGGRGRSVHGPSQRHPFLRRREGHPRRPPRRRLRLALHGQFGRLRRQRTRHVDAAARRGAEPAGDHLSGGRLPSPGRGRTASPGGVNVSRRLTPGTRARPPRHLHQPRGAHAYARPIRRDRRMSFSLVCLPFAGGGAGFYRAWPKDRTAEVRVVALQLPGREERFGDAPFTDVRVAARRMVQDLRHRVPADGPVALFGHSLGAVLAYEMARELEEQGAAELCHLFVSGSPGPWTSRDERATGL
ncbi:MFS transporter, partial [Streptomyces sp. SID4931]|nr:MFS transporter [Streptomyces sp. SID4931]